jgi:preprotein translocase subunit SecE
MSEKKEKKGLGDFFRGYKSELKKIVWPSWKTILKNTGIVITFIVILGLFIYAVDFLFSLLFNWVVGLM